jgi:hypothetical protein
MEAMPLILEGLIAAHGLIPHSQWCSLDHIVNFWVNCHPALTREQFASRYGIFEHDMV